jgi:hypothetical protein
LESIPEHVVGSESGECRRRGQAESQSVNKANLSLSSTRGDGDGMSRIGRILDRNVNTSVGVVFESAKEKVMKRLSQEEAKRGLFDNVGVNFKGDITDLHTEVLGTAQCLTSESIGTLHLGLKSGVKFDAGFLSKVPSDDNNLGALVKNPSLWNCPVN